MKLRVTLFLSLLSCVQGYAQLYINTDAPVIVTFGSTLAGVSNGTYTGTGFLSSPGTGKLDSDGWAVTGFSDGNLAFGSIKTSGDYARGTTTMLSPTTDIGATVGGLYAYTGAPFSIVNPALLIQPTDVDFTPGTLTLRIINNHPYEQIYLLDVEYDLWVRNNTSTSNKVSFSWSEDDVTYTPVSSLDYSSPAAAAASGIVSTGTHACTITGIDVVPGEYFYIRWTISDVSGSGERDEFYFDDITVAASNLLPVELTAFTAEVLTDNTVSLDWETATEMNSEYFTIERKSESDNVFQSIGTVEATGDASSETFYTFIDDAPAAGTNYYRLLQVDADGSFTYSHIVSAYTPEQHEDIILYPNPVADFLTITAGCNKIEAIKIFNTAGVMEYSKTGFNEECNISVPVSNLHGGLYYLQIQYDGKLSTKQFIKYISPAPDRCGTGN